MCGRYNLIVDTQALMDFFEIEQVLFDPALLVPRYNIAPNTAVPIVRWGDTGRELLMVTWGLVPHWSREPKTRYSTINARAETVAEKPTFRDAFKHRRCLIPATGFYEWKQAGKHKEPHHICLPDRQLFAFAGLWERWSRGGEGFESCSIIVTAANAAMRPVHERMPVILNQAQFSSWLNPAHYNRAQMESMLVSFTGRLDVYPVSRGVNNPENDEPACIEPI